MKVKVCGITSYEDAAIALDLGVDALGFNFHPPSPRYLPPEQAARIIRRLPPFAVAVGLFVNRAAEDVEAAARSAGVSVLQLHGDESGDYCRRLRAWPLIKALRMGGPLEPEALREYEVQAFLLDAKDDARYGGTGRTFDWSLAGAANGLRPIILAGGLKPENVGAAIRAVEPYAVDVCSGVESQPGKKDRTRLVSFMNEVMHATKNRQ